ncbi:hypothetical protein QR680_011793 [Steinernema hermaphroditum]|uniref:Uncharacterized protein n=1 Tax=Steinernema hermaphroditum TaxID=289476 RepID=A0AA39HZR8_9BILA|nr:hypothetical protein QR680_011793 [Steinernema hermaphroditum]
MGKSQIATDRQIVGLSYFTISVILTPMYVRIIHILLWHSEFRKLRCYQIMAQIGMIDCVFVLGYAVFGITLTFESQFYGITHVVLQLLGAVWLTKCSLNAVLAINRLTVMLEVYVPRWIHWTEIAFCWLIGLVYFVVCLTPKASLIVRFDLLTWIYDYSKPWTTTVHFFDLSYSSGALILSFFIYLITAYVLFAKRSQISTNNGNFRGEWRICVMALVLFSSPMTGAVLWNFATDFLPKSYWSTAIISIFSICNIALAAPIVYLCMNKALRRKVLSVPFFGIPLSKVHATHQVRQLGMGISTSTRS